MTIQLNYGKIFIKELLLLLRKRKKKINSKKSRPCPWMVNCDTGKQNQRASEVNMYKLGKRGDRTTTTTTEAWASKALFRNSRSSFYLRRKTRMPDHTHAHIHTHTPTSRIHYAVNDCQGRGRRNPSVSIYQTAHKAVAYAATYDAWAWSCGCWGWQAPVYLFSATILLSFLLCFFFSDPLFLDTFTFASCSVVVGFMAVRRVGTLRS